MNIPSIGVCSDRMEGTRKGKHMGFKISLAGDLGSGKSTVSKIIIAETGAVYYGTGVIARQIAQKYGMDIASFNIYMETHPELDREIDDGLRALSSRTEDMIIDSRMAWHFVEHTFRVYLTTDPAVSAARIMRDHRATELFSSLEEAKARIRARKDSERKRYGELYGVDNKDLCNYDLVIDTTYASPEAVAAQILSSLALWQKDESYRGCFLCPKRLCYPDDAPDQDLVSSFSRMIEAGAAPLSTVIEQNDNFYLIGECESALAYSLCDATFLPCRLMRGEVDPAHYIRMEDSL